jgi:VanZ family protein
LKNKKLFLTSSVLWLMIVTLLLCLPGNDFPRIGWSNKFWLDKWVHAFLFFVLVVLWSRFYASLPQAGKHKRIFLNIMLSGIAYGAFLELIQLGFIPLRSFDPADIAANGLGAWAGYVLSVRKFLKEPPP